MIPVHFYHWHASSAWMPAVKEHFMALRDAQFYGTTYVGLVGASEDRVIARNYLMAEWPDAKVCAEADEGFEQVTLHALHSWAKGAPPETPVLYAHTKGSVNPSASSEHWRRSMTHQVVGKWGGCALALRQYDAVGCHWLEPGVDYGLAPNFKYEITTPMFGGNFWWARAGYLTKLPILANDDRYAAESWIGLNNPKVLDLSPGWPVY